MDESANLLTVSDLTVDFSSNNQAINVLQKISFGLDKGKTLGIVGESGSGKSITALSIMGLLPPAAKIVKGSIILAQAFEKIDLLKIKPSEWLKIRGRRLGMIFQEPMSSLNPSLTCGEQIVEAIQQHQQLSKNDCIDRTLALLQEVQLLNPKRIFNAYPFEISGGQKQRVMIAMAIANNPDILIADEPTTALDVTVQRGILDLLQNIQAKFNLSILFITHDLTLVSEIAHKVLVMYKGQIVEQGSTETIFKNPSHAYTRGLLACRPPTSFRVEKLPTLKDFIKEQNVFQSDSYNFEDTLQPKIITVEDRFQLHKNIYNVSPIIQVKNLTKQFVVKRNLWGKPIETIDAVNNVTFDVYKGETLGLVGESGCGKTSLGRSLLMLTNVTSGEIWINNENILTLDNNAIKRLRKKIQIIFQDPYASLNANITIGSAITEVMKVHNLFENYTKRKENAIIILEKVGLSEAHFHRYPHELSGGQRQRACIARALAVNPEIIICDESVSALDVSVQAQVLNLLNELKKDFGFTYIFISHDLSVVKFMSDRLIVMQKGRIVAMGESDYIYQNPPDEYTQKLIQSIPKPIYQ